jgi:hypothetical protein
MPGRPKRFDEVHFFDLAIGVVMEVKKDSTDPGLPDNPDNDGQLTEEIVPHNGKPNSGGVPNPREDQNHLHTTRHGVLSRHPLEALAKAGENVRALRRLEKSLRAQFQPKGLIEELMFDRAWSCLLHCLLIARAEKRIFAEENQPPNFAERVRRTRAMAVATGNNKVVDRSENLLKSLSISQRYDSHYWREFNRAIGTLLLLRKGGLAGATQALSAAFRQNQDSSSEVDD